MGLKYIGYVNPNDAADRHALHGIPARDLTDDEVGDQREMLLASGLYRDTGHHAKAAEPTDAPKDKKG